MENSSAGDINFQSDINTNLSSDYKEPPQREIPCLRCKEVPEEYIALNCGHNFCLVCLLLMESQNVLVDETTEEYLCEVTCEICKLTTLLDKASTAALLATLQELMKNNRENNENIENIENNENNDGSEENAENYNESRNENYDIDNEEYSNNKFAGDKNENSEKNEEISPEKIENEDNFNDFQFDTSQKKEVNVQSTQEDTPNKYNMFQNVQSKQKPIDGKLYTCSEHKKEHYAYFCVTCSCIPLCNKCILNHDTSHEIKNLQNINENQKFIISELKNLKEKVSEKQHYLENINKNLKKNPSISQKTFDIKQELKVKIFLKIYKQHFTEIKERIENKEKELFASNELRMLESGQEYEKCVSEIEKIKSNLNNIKSKLSIILSEDHSTSLPTFSNLIFLIKCFTENKMILAQLDDNLTNLKDLSENLQETSQKVPQINFSGLYKYLENLQLFSLELSTLGMDASKRSFEKTEKTDESERNFEIKKDVEKNPTNSLENFEKKFEKLFEKKPFNNEPNQFNKPFNFIENNTKTQEIKEIKKVEPKEKFFEIKPKERLINDDIFQRNTKKEIPKNENFAISKDKYQKEDFFLKIQKENFQNSNKKLEKSFEKNFEKSFEKFFSKNTKFSPKNNNNFMEKINLEDKFQKYKREKELNFSKFALTSLNSLNINKKFSNSPWKKTSVSFMNSKKKLDEIVARSTNNILDDRKSFNFDKKSNRSPAKKFFTKRDKPMFLDKFDKVEKISSFRAEKTFNFKISPKSLRNSTPYKIKYKELLNENSPKNLLLRSKGKNVDFSNFSNKTIPTGADTPAMKILEKQNSFFNKRLFEYSITKNKIK